MNLSRVSQLTIRGQLPSLSLIDRDPVFLPIHLSSLPSLLPSTFSLPSFSVSLPPSLLPFFPSSNPLSRDYLIHSLIYPSSPCKWGNRGWRRVPPPAQDRCASWLPPPVAAGPRAICVKFLWKKMRVQGCRLGAPRETIHLPAPLHREPAESAMNIDTAWIRWELVFESHQ